MKIRSFVGGMCLAGAIACAGTAQAAEITIAGTATGCFGLGCLPAAVQTFDASGLTYNGSTFSVTTSGGFASVGNVATPPANLDNFGSFTVTGTPFVYGSQGSPLPFTLLLTFSAPTGIQGSNQSTHSATFFGSVSAPDAGGVSFDFDNTLRNFTFVNAGGPGFFSVMVKDVSITAGRVAAVTGDVRGQQAVVPEPASMLLLGCGLLCGGLLRRRQGRK